GLDRLYAQIAAQWQAAELGVDTELDVRRRQLFVDVPGVPDIVDAVIAVGGRIDDRVGRVPEAVSPHRDRVVADHAVRAAEESRIGDSCSILLRYDLHTIAGVV